MRPLAPGEVDIADRVMRLAFGTFFGAPDPLAVMGDSECVRPRFSAEPSWAYAAELDGELVGSNLATRWGSFAFFGPLSVHPDLWDRGIASALMAPIVDLFERWKVRQAALFTFANSTKHVGLYQKFGFWPQNLTAVTHKRISASPARERSASSATSAPETYARAASAERDAILEQARKLTGAIFEGLDVGHEIRAAHSQQLGDTVLLRGQDGLDGLAVCHCGAGEAGTGNCYVKFGAVSPGDGARARFERLLAACEAHAAEHGLEQMIAGVNLAREDACRTLLEHGYRPQMQGVIMQRPNEPGYCRADVYVIDDLR